MNLKEKIKTAEERIKELQRLIEHWKKHNDFSIHYRRIIIFYHGVWFVPHHRTR